MRVDNGWEIPFQLPWIRPNGAPADSMAGLLGESYQPSPAQTTLTKARIVSASLVATLSTATHCENVNGGSLVATRNEPYNGKAATLL